MGRLFNPIRKGGLIAEKVDGEFFSSGMKNSGKERRGMRHSRTPHATSSFDLLLWMVCLGIIAGVLSANRDILFGPGNRLSILRSLPRLSASPFAGRETVSILILGTDDRIERGRSDTMMVVTLDVRRGKAALLSIPRDSRVFIPGRGEDRINASYALGGPALARQAAEALIGRRIDYYVKTDFEGFKRIVDLMGGVEIEVEKRMVYHDRAQNLHINLRPGRQVLNGEEAMGYVRFRHDARGDIGRIERQQKFVRALLAQMVKPQMLLRLPQVLREITTLVETDLPARDLVFLARLAGKITPDDLTARMVPGKPVMIAGKSYWEVDRQETARLVAALDEGLRRTRETSPVISVEVLNGCGVPGAASKVAHRLIQAGFRVTRTDNADHFDYKTSMIIGHRGNRQKAKEVQSFLRTNAIVSVSKEESPRVDVTIILGRDFDRA